MLEIINILFFRLTCAAEKNKIGLGLPLAIFAQASPRSI